VKDDLLILCKRVGLDRRVELKPPTRVCRVDPALTLSPERPIQGQCDSYIHRRT